MSDLAKLHVAELEILKEVDRICKKNNISYFLDSGTALGAIRHKGFIPWDDDIDIGMLRDEYDKFITVAQKEIKEAFFLQILDTDINYNKTHAKVRMNGTLFVESANENKNMHQGIFIDIFPFDNLPIIFPKGFIKMNQLMQKIVSYRFEGEESTISWYKRAAAKVVFGKDLQKRFDRICTLFSKCKAKYVTSFAYINKEQLLYEKRWFKDTEAIVFEGEEYPIMKGWDEYLHTIYGDYMKLPPVEQRVVHDVVEVKFKEE